MMNYVVVLLQQSLAFENLITPVFDFDGRDIVATKELIFGHVEPCVHLNPAQPNSRMFAFVPCPAAFFNSSALIARLDNAHSNAERVDRQGRPPMRFSLMSAYPVKLTVKADGGEPRLTLLVAGIHAFLAAGQQDADGRERARR
jgi:hypothetical protein